MYQGILLDISGVLYQDDAALPGAAQAVKTLQDRGVDLRFVTNTSRRTAEAIFYDLKRMGFRLTREQLYTAPRAILDYLEKEQLRPYCLMHPKLEVEFATLNHSNPNAVVVCDAGTRFDYNALDKAFQVLLEDDAKLIAIGDNRYYSSRGRLHLDAGPFIKALEYASGKRPVVLGKPAKGFFDAAVKSLGLPHEQILMVGDDVEADVGGAMAAGLDACLVKTGKYRDGDERCAPDCRVAEDLPALVEELYS